MNETTLRAYRRHRAAGMRARDALNLARFETRPLRLDWGSDRFGRERATIDRDGWRVVVTVEDDDMDGWQDFRTFSVPEPGSVRVGERLWYLPESGYTLPMLAADYRAQGMARGVAWEAARRSLVDEYHDDTSGDYRSAAVTARAYRNGIELGTFSISGVVARYGWADLRDLEEIAEDVASEAIENARQALARLVASVGDTDHTAPRGWRIER